MKLTVIFKGAHTGAFTVKKAGDILVPNPDGSVTVGKAKTLPGSSIRVKAVINQVGPSTRFEVEFDLDGVFGRPHIVQDSFDNGDPDVTVNETIRFRK